MEYIDAFRDPAMAKALLKKIHQMAPHFSDRQDRPIKLMEFCGGHTHTIFRFGISELLPDWIELVHGPGCPVCVMPRGRIDDALAIAEQPDVIFTTFGDVMRVPGSEMSLLQAKALGADIRTVYSPLDALNIATANPDKAVVFFALGFETTMPSTALTLLAAEAQKVDNFSMFCNHITTRPTIEAVLDTPGLEVEGFLAPGHVCMVTGAEPLDFVASDHKRPIVITGFEPLDILQSILMLLEQLAKGEAQLENQYTRVANKVGNAPGLAAMKAVFVALDKGQWRGLGDIEGSGVGISDAYKYYDAEQRFAIENAQIEESAACQCGEVLKGAIKPWQCQAFGKACTPETPLGALMVSSEGACCAYYNYGDLAELLSRAQQAVPS